MKSLVILISGRGSNMKALLEAKLSVRVAAVISNNPEAAGLEIRMTRVFNCGIGMVLIISNKHVEAAMEILRSAGEIVWSIGTIQQCGKGEARTMVK